jgi:cystine transport system substrate-binding protein
VTKPSISSLKPLIGHWSLVIGRWSFVICHLSFITCLAACARPDDAWDRVCATGILRVGMDASFPPFETIAADGTLVGFDVDLAQELGQRLGPALSGAEGIEVQFVANLPYDGLYDALAVDRVDVVISALVVNPARVADFAYSTSYFDAGQVLVVQERPDRSSETCQVFSQKSDF